MITEQEYNEHIKMLDKADAWLQANKNRPDIDVYLKKFEEGLTKANEMIIELEKQLGRKMTSEEIREGFEEG